MFVCVFRGRIEGRETGLVCGLGVIVFFSLSFRWVVVVYFSSFMFFEFIFSWGWRFLER